MPTPSARVCPPYPDHPAAQPLPPPKEDPDCKPKTCPPDPKPKDPPDCPRAKKPCKCPTTQTVGSNCLQDLIEDQAKKIVIADKAKLIKADLEKFLDSTKKGTQAYSRDKYRELLEIWRQQDVAIAELLRKIECDVPWRCIFECHVCPLLYELYYAEQKLYDDKNRYDKVYDLQDLQYWYQRDVAVKQRRFDRIDKVLKAWTNPADTIAKALTGNKSLYDSALKVLGTEPGKALYDVFLVLVPMHLAIAPPVSPDAEDSPDEFTTRIDKKFTDFCNYGQGQAETGCGPDVGEWSLRQRLIGPQPYLIDPDDYFKLICCLIKHYYKPAKQALSDAESEYANVTAQIARYKDKLKEKDGWVKAFETDAKASIPPVINCCDYESGDDTSENIQEL